MLKSKIMYILIVVLFLFVIGCSGAVTKGCNSLGDVSNQINEIQVRLLMSEVSDPDVNITDVLKMLNESQAFIQSILGSVCDLKPVDELL